MEKFWKEFDPKGYSLWWMEYKNLPSQGKSLFRMNNSKNFFQKELKIISKNMLLGYMEFMGMKKVIKLEEYGYGEEMKYQKK